MLARLRPRLTFANVVSVLALFIALGGSAYAALKLPKNSVGSKQIKKNAVTSAKVKNGTLTASDTKKGQFALPGDLSKYLPAGGTAANSGALGGVPPVGFVHGAGKLLSAGFTGTSHSSAGPFVPIPGGGWIALTCNSTAYATFFHVPNDGRTYDRFTTLLRSGTNPTVLYKAVPGLPEAVDNETQDSETLYDISSSAGYAHVDVFGHFNSTTKACTVTARGWSSP
jgi:hypothetical protein